MSTVWPPNAHVVNGRPLVADRALVPDAEVPSPKQFLFGQPYREWVDAQTADVVLVKHRAFQQDALAKFREAPRRGVVVSTTSNALAEESANLLPVYVPPVRVELGDDGAEIEPNEPGIELLANGLHDRARLIGTDLGEVLRAETLRFLVVASGGIPAILWLSASETSRRSALAGLLPAPLDLARVVALDAARNWQLRFEQAGSRPDATTRRRTRRALRAREEDAGRLQVLIIDKRIVRRRHPLVRIAEGRALRS
ncbi:MAG: hypothetical protein JKY37_18220 [Nannocystaceae bacterium]|nr:hypothetical protein [Nannocystaceae bacterium]